MGLCGPGHSVGLPRCCLRGSYSFPPSEVRALAGGEEKTGRGSPERKLLNEKQDSDNGGGRKRLKQDTP